LAGYRMIQIKKI